MALYQDKYDYIRRLYGLETEEMAKARLSLPNSVDQITITPEDGRLLQILIHLAGVKTILELGTLGGYSSLCMAAALPPDGSIITIEKDQARFKLAQQNLAQDPRITPLHGDAMHILPGLAAKAPFDMIFIDADKLHYADYLDWAEKNIRKGGLIVADNTLLFGAAFDDAPHPRVRDTARQSVRAFNTRIADRTRYLGLLLPTEEGLTIAQKLF